MTGKRLILAAVMAALGLAVIGGLSNSTGQTADQPGLTYGGLKDQYPAWLRLAPGRSEVAALHIEWAVAPKRCSNHRGYESVLYAGFENFARVSVTADGRFNKTVVDKYRDQGSRYEEHMTVSGTIGNEAATGLIRGTVSIKKRTGRVVRCTFGPQSFRLLD